MYILPYFQDSKYNVTLFSDLKKIEYHPNFASFIASPSHHWSSHVWAGTGLQARAHLRLGQTVSKQVYSLNFVHSNSHFSIAFLLICTFAITRCLHQFRTHPTLAEVFQLHDSRCCLRQCAVLPMLASTGRIQRDAERSFWKALTHAPIMSFFLRSCFFLS